MENFILFVLPRSASHFFALVAEQWFAESQIPVWMRFRVFRDYIEKEVQNQYFAARKSTHTFIRINWHQETDVIDNTFSGTGDLFRKSHMLLINPRKDYEDFLLARIVPYYHWEVAKFDGLFLKNQYNFYDRENTWSPYEKSDILKLRNHYLENKIPDDTEVLSKVLDVVLSDALWFLTWKRFIIDNCPTYHIFDTDDLLIQTENDMITYDSNFPVIRYFNEVFSREVAEIKINNIKQQTKEMKLECFENPDLVLRLIDEKYHLWLEKNGIENHF